MDHPGEQFDVALFLDRRCKHSVEEIQAAVDGAVSREQATKLRECLQHIGQLNEYKENIEAELLLLAQPYFYRLERLRTVPGFSAAPLLHLSPRLGVDIFGMFCQSWCLILQKVIWKIS